MESFLSLSPPLSGQESDMLAGTNIQGAGGKLYNLQAYGHVRQPRREDPESRTIQLENVSKSDVIKKVIKLQLSKVGQLFSLVVGLLLFFVV